jgi:hypothetical protein
VAIRERTQVALDARESMRQLLLTGCRLPPGCEERSQAVKHSQADSPFAAGA